jgi:hypothetical protein
MRKTFLILFITLALSAILFIPARAFELDNDGIIPAGQVINDDLFIEAEKVVIDGTVNGNLFVNAADVIINGPVNGNLLIFGAMVKINAPVSGSVAFVGQSLELNNRVDGSVFATGVSVVLNPQAVVGLNLYFAGFNAQTMPGSKVGADASLSAYQAILGGEIARDVHAALAAFELNGLVGRDVQVEVENPEETTFSLNFARTGGPVNFPDSIPSGIRVSDTAEVGGTLKYISAVEQSSTIALPAAQVTYETLVTEKKLTPVEELQKRILRAARDWITLLILGALALRFLQPPLQRTTMASRRWLPALGWGMVVLMVTPLAIFLSGAAITIASLLLGVVTLSSLSTFVSVGGYLVLTLFVLVFLIILVYVSKLVVATSFGGWLCQRLWPNSEARPIVSLLIGISLYVLIAMLPFGLGLLFGVVVTFIGLGALWIAYRQRNLPPEMLAPLPTAHAGDLSEVA